jgi:hypothetical protein
LVSDKPKVFKKFKSIFLLSFVKDKANIKFYEGESSFLSEF